MKIAIVGGGLAGLTAGYLLEKNGPIDGVEMEITVFEATETVGGRVQTKYYDNGLYAETGAISITDTEEAILELARSLDISLVPRIDRAQKRYFADQHWGNEEAQYACVEYLIKKAAALKIDKPEDWLSEKYTHIDQQSFIDYLKENYNPKDKISFEEVVTAIRSSLLGLYTCNLEELSALDGLRFIRQYVDAKLAYSIEGGNQRLPKTIASILRRVILNQPVVSIKQTSQEVVLGLKGSDGIEEVPFDYVIMAVPLTALRESGNISFSPPLQKQPFISSIPYNRSIARVYYEAEERSWLNKCPTAMTITNKSLVWIEDHTAHIKSAKKAVLEVHASGDFAERIAYAKSPDDVATPVLAEIYPQFKGGKPIHTVLWDGNRPFQQGAYPYFSPGQLQHFKKLQVAEDRIFFAGEYTSLMHPASMNGAVVSAHRVTKELLKEITFSLREKKSANAFLDVGFHAINTEAQDSKSKTELTLTLM